MVRTKALNTLSGYLDYATVHGFGRLRNTPYVVLKVLWCFFLLGSLAMIIFQLVKLIEKYQSYPISTTIELVTPDDVAFPVVTICNTNPVDYYGFSADHELQMVVNEAFDKYFYGEDPTEANHTDFFFDSDILSYTRENFRMTLSFVDDESLVNMSEPREMFILLCNFAGTPCTSKSIVPVRTYEYGICYSILPEHQDGQNGSRGVAAAGEKFGLELLLNVDAENSVPFVTPSNGIYVMTNHANVSEGSVHLHDGVVIPTGFQADIGIYLIEEHRVPGKPDSIRCSNNNMPLSDCMQNCQHYDILKQCGCYQRFFTLGAMNPEVYKNATENGTGNVPCFSESHYQCILDTLNEHVKNKPAGCKKCKVPCNEIYYKRDLSMSSWPNRKYMTILQKIAKDLLPYEAYLGDITHEYLRENYVTLRIYLETLTHQNIIEEYSYSSSDFLSDIGGTLGLWAGFSVLSLLEMVELVFLLFAGWKREKKNTVEEINIKQ